MSGHLDPRLAALERRIERTLTAEPATALRHRVLMAVDDVLADRRPRADVCRDATVPGWAWAAAAAVGVAITLPVVAGASALARPEPPSLEARLRGAGLADDVMLLSVAAPAGQPAVAGPRAPDPHEPPTHMHVRVIDVRKCLEDDL